MSDSEIYDFFVNELLDNAVKEFKSTAQYRLLQDKLDQMDHECDTILTAEQKVFAVECFELLLDVGGQEEHFVYHKGLTDSVKILKRLGVLA